MDLVTPGIGLIVWTVVVFVILLSLLRLLAWKPILNAVKNREESIRAALKSADKAREEMRSLKADNEKILAEARAGRDEILKEARDVRERIIDEAKGKADAEARKLIEQARQNIQNEKDAAIGDLREQVAKLSVEIAGKILREKLSDDKESNALIDRLIKDIKLN
jgi:F-type H+-transporting ATPase subunit b